LSIDDLVDDLVDDVTLDQSWKTKWIIFGIEHDAGTEVATCETQESTSTSVRKKVDEYLLKILEILWVMRPIFGCP
jgi:hypothetical protein